MSIKRSVTQSIVNKLRAYTMSGTGATPTSMILLMFAYPRSKSLKCSERANMENPHTATLRPMQKGFFPLRTTLAASRTDSNFTGSSLGEGGVRISSKNWCKLHTKYDAHYRTQRYSDSSANHLIFTVVYKPSDYYFLYMPKSYWSTTARWNYSVDTASYHSRGWQKT